MGTWPIAEHEHGQSRNEQLIFSKHNTYGGKIEPSASTQIRKIMSKYLVAVQYGRHTDILRSPCISVCSNARNINFLFNCCSFFLISSFITRPNNNHENLLKCQSHTQYK